MKTAIVLGANGGIGEAFVNRFLHDNNLDLVLATYRSKPKAGVLQQELERLRTISLDVQSENDFQKIANCLSEIKDLDLTYIVNCIGLLDGPKQSAEKRVEDFNLEFFLENMIVNASPVALLCKHLKPFIKSASEPTIVSLSAKVGSISDNRLGGWYSYRASKAAMNMLLKTLSLEIGWWNKKANIYAIHPGTTKSALSEAYWDQASSKYQTHSPEESCNNIMKVVESK